MDCLVSPGLGLGAAAGSMPVDPDLENLGLGARRLSWVSRQISPDFIVDARASLFVPLPTNGSCVLLGRRGDKDRCKECTTAMFG
mmetsp:Transcript_27369/g.64335  ORF Transcript_27369/g.64335 Transcript_27369/m.64335 type:complete len:85 (-) Transcript_27369:816-1070(-)